MSWCWHRPSSALLSRLLTRLQDQVCPDSERVLCGERSLKDRQRQTSCRCCSQFGRGFSGPAVSRLCHLIKAPALLLSVHLCLMAASPLISFNAALSCCEHIGHVMIALEDEEKSQTKAQLDHTPHLLACIMSHREWPLDKGGWPRLQTSGDLDHPDQRQHSQSKGQSGVSVAAIDTGYAAPFASSMRGK